MLLCVYVGWCLSVCVGACMGGCMCVYGRFGCFCLWLGVHVGLWVGVGVSVFIGGFGCVSRFMG